MTTTTTEQVLRQAPFIESQQKDLLDLAAGVRDVRITQPTQQVAGLDPLSQTARGVGVGLGQYQPLLQQGQGTVGTGLGTLQGLGQGVGQTLRAGQGTVAGAIEGLGAGPAGTQNLTQAGQAFGASAGQFAPGQGYTAEGFDPNTISRFQNPFEQQAVQQALADIRREGEIARNQQTAAAVQTGAFGGSRDILARGELGRNVLEQQARTAAGMRQAGFQNAAQQAQAAFEAQQRRAQAESQFGTQTGQAAFEAARARDLQRGQGLMGLGIGSLGTTQANIANLGQGMLGQQAQVQSQLGALGQQTQQRQFDADYQQALRQAYEPYQRFGWMSDILKPTIGTGQSTLTGATAPSPSGFSQLVGAGIAGLGINQAIGNPLGKAFGSPT